MVFVVIGSCLAALIAVTAVADHRLRRRRRVAQDGAAMSYAVRSARRDVRAWSAGSGGHSGEDTSWMGRG
ncbi:hypothetical protein OYE22_15610 [Streptomyces sp. 71268]|uniref:hypothetical protein n=1 Tax=Streptomyces sp. 71268 TaxID=3002640 RepID=UPI0023F79433|nr:hypothetical protein [Streptomyces sp. 71268]WEV26469.1 hypothetical protein OYE22_15610 [Streptomyces sp. 71268]